MPRGIPTSTTPKPILVEELCKKIDIDIDKVYNPLNGTITKELLQEVCSSLNLSSNLSKVESANLICENLNLQCDSIDFNPADGTVSAGLIEKILIKL